MNISSFFIKRSIFCVVIFLLIILLGLLSLNRIPLREYPDIEKSQITIDTRYPGSSSATVETKITEIIENQISGIEELNLSHRLAETVDLELKLNLMQKKI